MSAPVSLLSAVLAMPARPGRRPRRKRALTPFLPFLAAAALLSAPAGAQSAPPEIPIESVPDFFKLPHDLYFGEVTGIAVNSKGHVFVFSRGNTTGPAYGAAAAQLLEFDADGNFVREIGHNLYAWSFAHQVRVDRHDNIWVADKGSDVVVRFDPEGRVRMVFGRKSEASDENAHPLEHPRPPLPPVDGLFRQVTDIAWDSDDNIFISDGYINSRVAKYDKDGNWIGSFGEPGAGPGQLNTPHSMVIDDENRIYVADRGNRRIQVFDTSGKVLKIIEIDVPAPRDAPVVIGNRPPETGGNPAMQPGAPWTLCITPGPTQYLYVADAYPGRIYKVSLDGEVLGWLGGAGRTLGKFGWAHGLACPAENELYVGELLNWRAQKLLLHPR
jgi:DNA-binding beta-propeller fold protein YncE